MPDQRGAHGVAPPDVLRLRADLLQHLLDELPHLRRTEGFAQTGYLSLFEKRALPRSVYLQ